MRLHYDERGSPSLISTMLSVGAIAGAYLYVQALLYFASLCTFFLVINFSPTLPLP
ncbi:uncharacterized protein BDV14DRAFT_173747 [Aspergillus stella-maris]|uniref:uncharacterized protein n=1 Tax=Aspergillus stella-maris TaxID=1810926 RepID=UPI003CCE1DF4